MKSETEHVDHLAQNLFLDFLEKSGRIKLGKKLWMRIMGEVKFDENGMVDCHNLSHGSAVLQLIVYIEEWWYIQ